MGLLHGALGLRCDRFTGAEVCTVDPQIADADWRVDEGAHVWRGCPRRVVRTEPRAADAHPGRGDGSVACEFIDHRDEPGQQPRSLLGRESGNHVGEWGIAIPIGEG